MASDVVVMVKDSPNSRFKEVGVYPLGKDESKQLFLQVGTSGVIVVRAIAILGRKHFSNAFADVPINIGNLDIITSPDGTPPQQNPGTTTGLNALAKVTKRDDDTQTYDVKIYTQVIPDGDMTVKGAQSYYDTLFLRRLVPDNGDDPYGAVGDTGGSYVTDLATEIDQTRSPGGSFLDEKVSEGTYLYVIDGHAGGVETVNVVSVDVDITEEDPPGGDGVQETDDGIQFSITGETIKITDTFLEIAVDFSLTVPNEMKIIVYLLDGSIELLLPDLTLASFNLENASPTVTTHEGGNYSLSVKVPKADVSIPSEDLALATVNGMNIPIIPNHDELEDDPSIKWVNDAHLGNQGGDHDGT